MCACVSALDFIHLWRNYFSSVVAVVHQPRYEIYRIFDNLVLLQSTGQCAYFGECARAALHFHRRCVELRSSASCVSE